MASELILIIDDNPTNLKLIKVLLTVEGYDVRTARDADEALSKLKNFQPRVILMDLQLPGMDGLQLTRKLKQDAAFEKTLILAVSAYAMKGDAEKAIDAGCDGYITKPIDIETLPTLIEEYLRNQEK